MKKDPDPRDDVLPRVHWVGKESRNNANYFQNNEPAFPSPPTVLQWTSAGTGFFQTREKRELVPAGRAMVFSWAEPTRYGYPPEFTDPYEFTAITFTRSLTLQPLFEELRLRFGSVLKMSADEPAARLLEQIYQFYVNHRFLDAVEESEMILALFHAIYREQQAQEVLQDVIARGHSLIRHRYRSSINLKMIAQECGVSREHFIRSFTKRYQQSPGAMLRGLRLHHARQLLQTTGISIRQIAKDCGFLDSNSFCRAFRQEYGQRPLQSRTNRQQPT